MKGKYKQNNKRKAGNVVLKKYMIAVGEFVKSKAGDDEAENEHDLGIVKKKSRKELRREKRKKKKAKMKNHYEGKRGLVVSGSDGEKSGTPGDKQQQRKKVEKAQKEVQKTPLNKSSHAPAHKTENSKTQPKAKKGEKVNKLQESRKMALLEANEEEDREIKKLERRLGLNKRKNKKNLPQSFVADGLDYILGVIDSGSSAAGMYDSDHDMDMAKDNFEKLDKNDPQSSGEDEETGDEMESEGSDEDKDKEDKDDDGDDNEMEDEEEAEEEEEMEDEDVLDGSDATESDGGIEDLSEQEEEALDTVMPGSTTENVSWDLKISVKSCNYIEI